MTWADVTLARPHAPLPSPSAVRLWPARVARAAPRRVPFGLAAWSDDPDAPAVAIVVEVPDAWPASGYGSVEIVAAQLPPAESLARGSLVVILGEVASEQRLLGRLLMRRAATVARAVRGSALLARGYARLGGAIDAASRLDLAWGYALKPGLS